MFGLYVPELAAITFLRTSVSPCTLDILFFLPSASMPSNKRKNASPSKGVTSKTESTPAPAAASINPAALRLQQEVEAHRRRQVDPKNYVRTPKSGLLVLAIATFFAVLGSITLHLHYKLPHPKGPTAMIHAPGISPVDAAAYHPSASNFASSSGKRAKFHESFSEANAVDIMQHLSVDIGYRIVGTKEHVQAEDWFEAILRRYEGYHNTGTPEQPGRTQVEVWKQIGDGAHRFDFMSNVVWKRYYSMSNLVVRISDGTEESKANSLLLNAHLDSTLPSPGAADDGVGIAILLEALRILTLPGTGTRLHNSVVLLFNNGEESLQDASHLYITQHNETANSVKAVVNLEACGTSGPELLFQATSEEMIEAYSKVPHPFGTVLANDIFSTGLILSDTDFRQFVEYGNGLTGLDMALVGNSYLYHTRKDVPKYLQPGATQHFGENTLAIIEHLCLKKDSESLLRGISRGQTRHSLPIYFSIAGKYFILFSNKAFKSIVMAVSAFINFQLSSIVRAESGIGALNLTLLCILSALFSLVGAAVGANAVAYVMAHVLGKGMSWYKNEFHAVLLYGPPALASVLAVQYLASRMVKPYQRPYLERASLSGLSIFFNIGLLGLNAFGIGSAYLMALASVAFTIGTTVNDFILIGFGNIEDKLVAPDNRVSHYTYFILAFMPSIVGTEGIVSFLDLFVPLTGRMGEISPADNIIATIVAVLVFLCLPFSIPLSHRFTGENLRKTILGLLGVTAVVMAIFASPMWKPFDADHPKRLFVHQIENITSNEWHMNLGSADPAPGMAALAQSLHAQLGLPNTTAELREMNVYNPDFDVLYPVSDFLTPWKFQIAAPLHHVSRYAAPAVNSHHFIIKAQNEVIDLEQRTRKVTLEIHHEGVIWSVIAFDAEILEWNLPSAPPPGRQRHHIKEVSREGISTWSVDLLIRLDDVALQAARARLSTSSKLKKVLSGGDSHGHLVRTTADGGIDVERDPSRLWIDTSGLVADEMFPQHASLSAGRAAMDNFIKMDKFMQTNHPEVDTMMLAVVGAVVQA